MLCVCLCGCVKINEAMNVEYPVKEKGIKLSDYYDFADWISKGVGGCMYTGPEQVGQPEALLWKFSRSGSTLSYLQLLTQCLEHGRPSRNIF